METAEYVIIGFIIFMAIFTIVVLGTYIFKPEMWTKIRENDLKMAELEAQAAVHEKQKAILRAEQKVAVAQEMEKMPTPPEPEVVYVETNTPVQTSGSNNGLNPATKTVAKAGIAAAAGYAFGRRFL